MHRPISVTQMPDLTAVEQGQYRHYVFVRGNAVISLEPLPRVDMMSLNFP